VSVDNVEDAIIGDVHSCCCWPCQYVTHHTWVSHAHVVQYCKATSCALNHTRLNSCWCRMVPYSSDLWPVWLRSTLLKPTPA